MNAALSVLTSPLLALAVCASAVAAEGVLDPSFVGGNGATSMNTGTVILPPASFGSAFDVVYATVTLPDGKILIAGRSGAGDSGHVFVARLNPDGSLDTDFAAYNGGFFTYHSYKPGGDEARGLVVDYEDDLIYVGANLGNSVGFLRLNANGVQDQAYGVPTSGPGSSSLHLSMNAMDTLGDFVGTYDGSGHRQLVVGGIPAAGASSVPWQVISLPTVDRDVVPTASIPELLSCGPFCVFERITIVGYADLSDISGHTGFNCMIAYVNAGASDGGASYYNPAFTGTGCFFDGMNEDANGNIIAVGRQFFPSDSPNWEPYWVTFDSSGDVLAQGSGLGGLSSTGSNSLRSALIQIDGKWIFAGFAGVDASGLDGFAAERLSPLAGFDAGWDAGFGSGGRSIFSVDPLDESYGYSDSQSFAAALDKYGRVVMAGDVTFGLGNDNQSTRIAVARLTSDLVFVAGFDPHD